MNRHHLLAAACVLAISGTAQARDCEYEKELSVDLRTSEELRLDVGSGSLTIRGIVGAEQVTAVGRACASSQNLLNGLELEGTPGRLVAHYPDSNWSIGKRYASIDLEIELPAKMLVDIDDGSGSIDVADVAGLRIDDGSGSIKLLSIGGDVDIEDGSGSIRIEGVDGTVTLDDGSGEIDINDVERDVVISEDGSGSIKIANVSGDVNVEEDGSGSITIREVGGSVRIDRDGSGSINVKSVAGNLDVGDAGSGGVNYAQIQGKVSVPDDNKRHWK